MGWRRCSQETVLYRTVVKQFLSIGTASGNDGRSDDQLGARELLQTNGCNFAKGEGKS